MPLYWQYLFQKQHYYVEFGVFWFLLLTLAMIIVEQKITLFQNVEPKVLVGFLGYTPASHRNIFFLKTFKVRQSINSFCNTPAITMYILSIYFVTFHHTTYLQCFTELENHYHYSGEIVNT